MAKVWYSLRPNEIIKKAKDKGFKDFDDIYMKTTIRLMPEPASIIGDLNWNGGKDPWMIKVNQANLVTEVAEKNPISDIATVGYYYWKKGSDFVKYAEDMIEKDIRVNNEF